MADALWGMQGSGAFEVLYAALCITLGVVYAGYLLQAVWRIYGLLRGGEP